MIHPTAVIAPSADIDPTVSVGPFTVIHGNVSLGPQTEIGGHCEIGYPTPLSDGRPLVIGAGALIRSHSVFYEGSRFGEGLRTGHRVTVREGTQAGRDLQIGTLGDIQGNCTIGNHVRFHSNVHIGQHSVVGDYVWIFPYVVLTNDPHPPSEVRMGVTVEDYAAVATMSVILPGITVGSGALVGAGSVVTEDVERDSVVAGNPARKRARTEMVAHRQEGMGPAYPWRRHFHRGYPADVVERWKAEFRDL